MRGKTRQKAPEPYGVLVASFLIGTEFILRRHALGAAVMLPSSAQAQAETAAKVDDSALKSRIETRLKSAAALKDDTITVAVENGVVTLTGTVDSKAQSLQAARLAHVKGVTNVENKLDVESKTEKTMEKAEAKTGKTMDKAGEKAERAGEKTKDAVLESLAEMGGTANSKWLMTVAASNDESLRLRRRIHPLPEHGSSWRGSRSGARAIRRRGTETVGTSGACCSRCA